MIHRTYKTCVNQLLLVKLPGNSKLLAGFGEVRSSTWIFSCMGLSTPNPCVIWHKAPCLHPLISGSEQQTLVWVWGPRLNSEKACLTTDTLLRQTYYYSQSPRLCDIPIQWMLREEPPVAPAISSLIMFLLLCQE